MISLSSLDIFIILAFFIFVISIGLIPGKKDTATTEGFLLSERKVGLFLFILTNVATWYGGILGVGEFTYRFGLLSWFTQGLPYYVFAILFAIFFSKKIREASLYTIPDKLEKVYGSKTALLCAGLLFVLVSPAPYLLMVANLLSLVFHINIFWSLILGSFLSAGYLFKGGYKSYVFADAFQFFIMFAGFIVTLIVAYLNLGDFSYLQANLPANHLKIPGGVSYTYILVWFLIALWTFTDPGFHQRCYAAKNGNVARNGIIISVFFWALFDFLTTSVGLYSRAALPGLQTPVLSYPLLAEKLLGSGLKGLFYAAMFATILSTSNSFFFLSATTISKDFLFKLNNQRQQKSLKSYTYLGIVLTAILSISLAYFIPSVIDLWYTIGTVCIPGIILLVVSAYYPKFRVSSTIAVIEVIVSFLSSLLWLFIRDKFSSIAPFNEVEPMIIGLIIAALIHFGGVFINRHKLSM
ncbi:MAG: sodium:solute symporter family protein [Bacteroidota bacterium]|nr:sodium:solute symporter family protein [Bacteroidota bacterium]MDP4193608.1 sodium:solute symporter family protein [Bacteroidota bacterium]